MISIQGLNKAAVLAALYNAARPQGMGFLQYNSDPMEIEEAHELLRAGTSFDYLKGRVMKVDLSTDELNPRLFDRDNGAGTAERIITLLRETGSVNSFAAQVIHSDGRSIAADAVKERLNGESTVEEEEGSVVFNLGLKDVAHVLEPAVNKAVEEAKPPGYQ